LLEGISFVRKNNCTKGAECVAFVQNIRKNRDRMSKKQTVLFFIIMLLSFSHIFAEKSKNKIDGIFFDASYTYWCASEDGLTLGRAGNFLLGDDPFLLSSNELLEQSFKYRSGFKVGTGWRNDIWILSAEYTWVRNTTSQTVNSPLLNPLIGNGVWLVAPWFLHRASDGGSLSGTTVNSKWCLSMDLADLTLKRNFYPGDHLKVTPFGGLRSAFIRQKFNITLTETQGIFSTLAEQPIHSFNSSNSWSIGPRFGSEAVVFFEKGFGINGQLAFDLLYTRYTKVFHKEEEPSSQVYPRGNIFATMGYQSTLRPVVECALGVKWEKSLSSGGYLSLLANYDFMVWWDQNMMRQMLNQMWNETSVNGNLYLHGVTVSGTFGF